LSSSATRLNADLSDSVSLVPEANTVSWVSILGLFNQLPVANADNACRFDTPLTQTLEPTIRLASVKHMQPVDGIELEDGGEGQNRTVDTTIFSRMLYQLSYLAPHADHESW
jgi:hypothetical protein